MNKMEKVFEPSQDFLEVEKALLLDRETILQVSYTLEVISCELSGCSEVANSYKHFVECMDRFSKEQLITFFKEDYLEYRKQLEIKKMETVTIKYQDQGGFMRHFKVSLTNPRDFKPGDKYIVIGQSKKVETVESEHAAKRLNESTTSIISGDIVRRAFE